ncbi:MAG: hypothetical protein IKR85_00010 [Clostridia bacterium]|nr:hypothetical protein [Clostridia bacterium]
MQQIASRRIASRQIALRQSTSRRIASLQIALRQIALRQIASRQIALRQIASRQSAAPAAVSEYFTFILRGKNSAAHAHVLTFDPKIATIIKLTSACSSAG